MILLAVEVGAVRLLVHSSLSLRGANFEVHCQWHSSGHDLSGPTGSCLVLTVSCATAVTIVAMYNKQDLLQGVVPRLVQVVLDIQQEIATVRRINRDAVNVRVFVT